MGVNSISSGTGSITAVITTSRSKANSVSTNSQSHQAHQDTVKLSGPALAKSLMLKGLNPSQIALQMGIKITTVDSYLNIKPVAVTPKTAQTTKVVPAEPCWITDIVSSTPIL